MTADTTGENFVRFGEEGGQLTYGSYLRLAQLLDCPAPRVRPAGARRAAVHHHPPGLRAVVPAAPARGGDGARRPGRDRGGERRTRPVVRPPPARPDARDRAGAGPAGRRAGDDDAAGLPGVPAAPRTGERLPVRAVPRAGVPHRRQGRGVRRALPWPHRRGARAAGSPPGGAEPVGRVRARARRGRAGHLHRRGDHGVGPRRPPTTARRTPTSGGWPRRCCSTTSSPRPGVAATSSWSSG